LSLNIFSNFLSYLFPVLTITDTFYICSKSLLNSASLSFVQLTQLTMWHHWHACVSGVTRTVISLYAVR